MSIKNLPTAFLSDMQKLLKTDYASFLKTYDEAPYVGLRVNRLKLSVEKFLEICPFELEPIPWTDDGFYFNPEDRPAKHPYYHAGLYYLQEPSAMAPAAVLRAEPGDLVADLCAAPGGKSLQTASFMKGEGLLVSNDISASRLKALVKNVEMAGIKNVIVMCADPVDLTNALTRVFDKILVDAPCSGEGMFRRDPKGIQSWTEESKYQYADIQSNIMDAVAVMLKEGGICSYSTCTFAMEENEKFLDQFLKKHETFNIDPISNPNFETGIVMENMDSSLSETGRLWPHKVKGEGHFVARLKKQGEHHQTDWKNSSPENVPESFQAFVDETMVSFEYSGAFRQIKEKLLLEPNHDLELKGLRVLRSGWYLGDLKKNRFEPSQAFAMGLKKENMKRTLDLAVDSQDVYRYLKGETISCAQEKGWILVTVDGYPLGWGKVVNGKLNNKYPASWRML